ncbi:hypothetical protein EXQ35_03710, partial [Clostridium botulinum]|nr:hypothetical protein [Clostridium botulinum]
MIYNNYFSIFHIFSSSFFQNLLDFPDALSASALASSIGSPLVLAPYQVGKDATDLIDSMGCKNL